MSRIGCTSSADPGRSGLGSWIFSTDHKRIGMLYLCCILSMFAVGVVLGVLMRLELIAPGRSQRLLISFDFLLPDGRVLAPPATEWELGN